MATRGARTGTAPTRSPGTWPPRTSPPSASPPSGAQRRGRTPSATCSGRCASGARGPSSPGAARSRASANGVKRQSRAAAAGARCRSRADVAGWPGRWHFTATRHSLPAVRAAAACRPLAGCVCAAGCRPSQTNCHRGRACGAEWPPGEARCAHRRRRRAARLRVSQSWTLCSHRTVNNQQQHSQHPKSGYSTTA